MFARDYSTRPQFKLGATPGGEGSDIGKNIKFVDFDGGPVSGGRKHGHSFIYALYDHRLGNKGHCVLLPTPDELCSRHVGRGWMNHSETFKDDSFVVAQTVAKIVSRGVV